MIELIASQSERAKRTRNARLVIALSFAISIGFASGPLDAQIAVGNSVEEHTASAGDTYVGTIQVRNLTSEPQPVRIYQTDYTFFADGTSHFDSVGSAQRSNAKWITPATSSITVPPLGEMTVGYTVRVPLGDSLAGTYWSMIMFEGAPNGGSPKGKGQLAIGSIMRYAIQIATHIGVGGSRKILLSKQNLSAAPDGSHWLELEVMNVGERGYRPLLWIELYDDKGKFQTKSQQQRGLLYPGTSVRQRFDLGKIGAGTYKAVVFADTGDDAVFAAQYRLHF
jgi:hypothetical protein